MKGKERIWTRSEMRLKDFPYQELSSKIKAISNIFSALQKVSFAFWKLSNKIESRQIHKKYENEALSGPEK